VLGRLKGELASHLSSRKKHKEKEARTERSALCAVRAQTVTLAIRRTKNGPIRPYTLNVVSVRESRTNPRGEKPIEWFLLTNHPIRSQQDVERIILGYTFRWRIEDFHQAWKTGLCNVEETQLHSTAAVIRWSTILAAVAARSERLKHLSRQTPDQLATIELSDLEIETLRLLRAKYGPRKEKQPRKLTIALAVRWIADLGGYMGRSSSGPPGSITIQRGLSRLLLIAEGRQLGPPSCNK